MINLLVSNSDHHDRYSSNDINGAFQCYIVKGSEDQLFLFQSRCGSDKECLST